MLTPYKYISTSVLSWTMISCLVLLFLSFLQNISAQSSKIDSLSTLVASTVDPDKKGELLLELAPLYFRKDLEKYKALVDQAKAIKTFAADEGNAHKISYHYSNILDRESQYDKAKDSYQELLSETNLDSALVSLINYKLGNLLRKEGRNDKAIEHLLIAKEIDQKRKDVLREASVDIVLGIIHKQTQQYPEAVAYYSSAYEVYKAHDQKENMSTAVLNIANVHMRQDSFSKALTTYQEALDLANKTEKDEDLLAYIYNNLSNLYTRLDNHKKALEYAEKSYELRKDLAGTKEKLNSLIGIAQNQEALNRIDQSLSTVKKALAMAASADGVVEELQHLYHIKYKIHEHKNQLRPALITLKEYLKYHDSLSNIEMNKQAIELNKKYETEQKQNKIARL